MLRALVLVVALCLTACGGPTGYRCSPQTCSGCCTAADSCEPGTTAKACGVGGALFCRDCGTSLCSDAGVCFTPPTCSPSCRGCCDPRDGRCIEQLSDSQCQPPAPWNGNWCVSCQAPQICGYRDPVNIGCIQPWTCAVSCGAGGCCDVRRARCIGGPASDAGACL